MTCLATMHNSWCRRPAGDRDVSFATGLWYPASVPNTWCRCVDDVARSKSRSKQATGSDNHQGAREAAITGCGCAVLYASSTFRKHTCMQAK